MSDACTTGTTRGRIDAFAIRHGEVLHELDQLRKRRAELSEKHEALREEVQGLREKNVERLTKERDIARDDIAALSGAIEPALEFIHEVARWREKCHEYDEDMGHEPRDFDEEEWDILERAARRVLAQLREVGVRLPPKVCGGAEYAEEVKDCGCLPSDLCACDD